MKRSLLPLTVLLTVSLVSCKKDEPDAPAPAAPSPQPFVCQPGATLSDVDGNSYPVVLMDTTCWMAADLRVTRYRNGDPIPVLTDGATWTSTDAGARAEPGGDAANIGVHGLLYNGHALNDPRGLCPIGWRIPTEAEWQLLVDALGGFDLAGGPLKDTVHWDAPNVAATNAAGLSVRPAGSRQPGGAYLPTGTEAYLWSSTMTGASNAWARLFSTYDSGVYSVDLELNAGAACRCIRE